MGCSRWARAGVAVAAGVLPLTLGRGVAGAGQDDEKHASTFWDYSFPSPSGGTASCGIGFQAQLLGFTGTASVWADDPEADCQPIVVQVTINYTNRDGGRSSPTVESGILFGPAAGDFTRVVAHDVEGDMTAEADIHFWCEPGHWTAVCSTSRTLTPK